MAVYLGSKYKEIAITGCSTDQTDLNYTITVTYESSMSADFSDIRFVDSDGLTSLNQYRESYTASTSSVWWIQVDVTTAGKTIYMYYGNSGLSLNSEGDDTFPFFDDFTGDDDDPPDTDKWDVTNATYTKIKSNTLRIFTAAGNLTQSAYSKTAFGAGYGLRFKIMRVGADGTQSKRFGWGDGSTLRYGHYFTTVGKWVYYLTFDEDATSLGTGAYHIIMVNMITSELKRYYFDDDLEYSNDSRNESNDQKVTFYIHAWAPGDDYRIDWVFVTKLPDDDTELEALEPEEEVNLATEPTKYLKTTDLSLSSPRGICVDTDLNRVLVCDAGNDKLLLVDIIGNKTIASITTYGVHNSLDNPYDACYYDGYFYVCDTDNHAIIRLRSYDLDYKDCFGTIGTSGSSTSLLNTPNGVCHNKEYLFVCDSGNNRIMKLTLSTLAYDSAEDTFNSTTLDAPRGICYRKDGDKSLYISDYGNTRLIKASTSFTYHDAISSITANHCVVIDDMIHVCDGDNDQILIYDTASLTLRETLVSTVDVIDNPWGIDHYRDAIIFTGTTDGYLHDWRRYNPRDALTQSSAMKFGGKFFDNPMIVVGRDTLIAGATAESGSPNRWKEENSLSEVGWVEED